MIKDRDIHGAQSLAGILFDNTVHVLLTENSHDLVVSITIQTQSRTQQEICIEMFFISTRLRDHNIIWIFKIHIRNVISDVINSQGACI